MSAGQPWNAVKLCTTGGHVGAIFPPAWKGQALLEGAECCQICSRRERSAEARRPLAFSKSPSLCKVWKVGDTFGLYFQSNVIV